ncbi:hypothetical protein T4E_10601 [Trichinella pseudospiralis]|uniref:Uncharacterized protein n=1 Tax=Trichinella pseudospiralis TaxID=6337 RepID=A0A0V0W537_TRIPS|nr:hypothetical protein T4E_10601 [Trichinella pseudospiralis]
MGLGSANTLLSLDAPRALSIFLMPYRHKNFLRV